VFWTVVSVQWTCKYYCYFSKPQYPDWNEFEIQIAKWARWPLV